MLKKLIIVLISIVLMISVCSVAHAADLKTSLEVIQKASETKDLENDQGFISKTIVDSDAEKGEVTIELKLSNTKKASETTVKRGTEIILVIDNSPSMDFVTSSGQTRKEIVLGSAKQLVNSIYALSSDIKVGLVDFHGVGGLLSNSPYAAITNATLRQELTADKATMISALDAELERSTESGTNIDAGLKTAKKNFTKEDTNKIVVLLTDGVPNADASLSGTIGNDIGAGSITSEKGILIQDNTKKTIQDLKANDIYVISMLTGLDASDGNTDKNGRTYTDVDTIEDQLTAVERIFGTPTNPTADRYYQVKTADVNKIITEDILEDVTKKIQNPLNTIKIVDYFPEDIIDNFDFSYVGTPNVGTATNKIDETTKTITWDMETLKGDEVATLKYKLKLKDMQNSKLLNKTIATNQKVVLTYKDNTDKSYTVELTSSPKIQLKEIKEDATVNNVTNDTTISTKIIPQTGVGIGLTVAIISVAGIVGFAFYKSNKFRNM